MKYVVERKEARLSGEGRVREKIYIRKKLEKGEWFCITFLSVMILVVMFVLGFYAGTVATTETIEAATEEVPIVDEPESFYSTEIPLSYTEQAELMSAAEEFGVDYHTMLGLIERETNFRNVSGDSGKASGYCQIWKVYWGELMREIGAEDLTVPKDNFRTACAIVSELTDRYGSLAGALTAYNRGSYDGRVTEYATSVLENAEKWREI